MLYSITFVVMLYQMKNLPLHNVSILMNFYENQFINEYTRRILSKFRKDIRTDGRYIFLCDEEELTILINIRFYFIKSPFISIFLCDTYEILNYGYHLVQTKSINNSNLIMIKY